ncbi:sensor histidine kinase [Paenibacillus sp.]|uniref:sensor histidine kinase n=1 Tax=Paenibacillus sp. TaxID=58172 RepID=UPI002D5DB643|nr:sensor histidine kinase [Paenibacillus sp.]HZG57961.1 sensor histidine kinase [Paenibacillus sp.]
MFRFGKWKYRHKIAAIIFIFSLIPMLVLGSVLFFNVWQGKVADILEKNEAQLAGGVAGVDNMLASNVDKMLFINNNFYINNYLETKTDQNLVGIMSFNDYLQSVIGAVKADLSNVDVVIYSMDEATLNGDYLRNIATLGAFEADGGRRLREEILASNDGSITWRLATLSEDGTDADSTYLYAFKKLSSFRGPLGVTEIRMPFSSFPTFFQFEMPKGSMVVFETSDGAFRFPIGGGDDDGAASASPENHYEIRQALKSGIGTVTMYVPRALVFQELRGYLLAVAAMFVGVTIMLFVTVETVAFFLTKKFEVLFRRMNTTVENLINNENLQISTTDDEFSRMGNVFFELIVRIRDYYKRITEFESERTVLETQLLQERINPHFLYNTLSTMRWISGDERIRTVIHSMVRYYRIALNKGSSIVTIEQELDMMREYLSLQKFAYGIEFDFEIFVEEGLGDKPLVKHLLQPVVENAVLHGINGRETGGAIGIRVTRHADDIRIAISDNGAGIDPERIRQMLSGESVSLYSGYGMVNTRKRIEVYYGPSYGIEIASEPGQGTTVTLRVPAGFDAAAAAVRAQRS